MAQQLKENVTKSSDIFILTELALAKASKTFAPFGDVKAVVEIARGNIGKNIAEQQNAGLKIEAINKDLALTDDFQKDLSKASSFVEELKILDLKAENLPENLKMLETQTSQFTQQLKTHIGDLELKQNEFGNILQQTAEACANLSDEIKKILAANGTTNIDSKVIDQKVYELFLSQSGKIKGSEKKIINALVPEKERKAAMNSAIDFVKTLSELQKTQDETSNSLNTITNAVETTQEDLKQLHAQRNSIDAFNSTAQKIIKTARDQIETGALPETPGAQASG